MAALGRLLLSGLGKLWGLVGGSILSFLWGKLTAAIAKAVSNWKKSREIKAAAQAEREATEAAQTQEEREHAADQNRRL